MFSLLEPVRFIFPLLVLPFFFIWWWEKTNGALLLSNIQHTYICFALAHESVCFLINSWLMELFFTTYHYLSFLQPLTLQVQTFDIEHLFSALSKQKSCLWIFNRTSGSWTSTVLNDFWWLTEREKPNNSYQSWYFIILAIPKLREFN